MWKVDCGQTVFHVHGSYPNKPVRNSTFHNLVTRWNFHLKGEGSSGQPAAWQHGFIANFTVKPSKTHR